jgi:Orotidine-5''-phosphate decarboxylase
MSPFEAYKNGADFIVAFRPITKSEDPRKAFELFL